MKRREFLKALWASGMSVSAAGSLSSLLAGCSREEAVEMEDSLSLFDRLDQAQIIAPRQDAVRKTSFVISGESREVLLQHPDSTVTFHQVPLHKGAQLRFGIGINEPAWKEPGDGVEYEIVITDDSGTEHPVYSRLLDPKQNPDDRGWFDETLDLQRFQGKEVSLTLRTTCGAQRNCEYDWAGWSGLEINAIKRFSARKSQYTNILLISLDTLRADHLGCYGDPRTISPTIDNLARRGVLFKSAIAQSPWTLPSHMSILTGLYPAVHGVGSSNWELSKDSVTLAELLKSNGYHTAAFVDGGYLGRKYGYGQGFDLYDDQGGHIAIINKKAMKFIKNHFQDKFFLFMHVYDIHGPYDPPKPYQRMYYTGNERDPHNHSLDFAKEIDYHSYQKFGDITDIDFIKAAYAGEVTYVDHQLAALFALLEKLGIFDNTLVIVLSDHGESLFEHHVYIGHGIFLYDNEMKIPLIFKLPGSRYERTTIDAQVESIDILPTILDVLDLSEGEAGQGRSLTRLMTKEGAGDQEACAFGESSNSGGTCFVRSLKWKYIGPMKQDLTEVVRIHLRPSKNVDLTGYIQKGEQLYNLESDPLEMVNLIDKEPAVARQLRERLGTWEKENKEYARAHASGGRAPSAEKAGPALTEEEKEELRALGYVQ